VFGNRHDDDNLLNSNVNNNVNHIDR
jgi:hypothetical protein